MRTRKGFTLVELLAVIVILGILMVISIPAITRWIDRSKVESIETQRKTLLMAGESYAQANTNSLPKTVGSFVEISASQLKEANFLNNDILNADKESCMTNSFVRIYKYDKTGYTYTAYIYCGSEKKPEDVHINPTIQIAFVGSDIKEGKRQNVGNAAVDITITGNQTNTGDLIGLTSYRYVVSANYGETSAEKVELYNSNDIVAGGKHEIKIHKDLTTFENYTDITNFNVYVEAYNQDGGYSKNAVDSSYKDTTPPKCGKVVGQAGVNEWNKDWKIKKVSVECDDGDGSGCVKDVYTKTFKDQSDLGTIEIADNAGNKTLCDTIRVHLDWTNPTMTSTVTNDFASSQTVTINVEDNLYVDRYYFGTVDPLDSDSTAVYTSIIGDRNIWTKSEVITEPGTYYFSIKDKAGNAVTISKTFYRTTLTPNRGSVSVGNVLTASGNTVNLPVPSGVTGYGFAGWCSDSGLTTLVSNSYKPTVTTTLYGKWTACGKGTYSNNNVCTACPKGTYSTGDVNSSCTNCPSGYTTAGTGTKEKSSCYISCGANKHVKTVDGGCVNCASGYEKGAHTVYSGNTSACKKKPSPPPSDDDDDSGGSSNACSQGCCYCGCGCCGCKGCHCGGCFLAGTKVMTIFGPRDIDKLKIGDLVLTYNEKTGENEYKPVEKPLVHINFTEDWYTLTMDDQSTLRVAQAHKFYIKRETGFDLVKARELKVGDMVRYSDGTYHAIVGLSSQLENHTEYNLNVRDNHNYYVGDQQILVHNRPSNSELK